VNAVQHLVEDIAAIGATIEAAKDRIVLRAGSTAIPANLISRIRLAKAELLETLAARPANHKWAAEEWQAFFDERAGVTEFDGGLSRTSAEAKAFEACIIEWLNINPAPSLPGRYAWCGRAETRDAVVLPYGAEPGTHAWLHAECWAMWQEDRRAQAVKSLMQMGIGPASVNRPPTPWSKRQPPEDQHIEVTIQHVLPTENCALYPRKWTCADAKTDLSSGPQATSPISSSFHHPPQSPKCAYHEHNRRKIDWAEMCDPIKLEVSHVVIGQGHSESYDWRNHGSDPRPPFAATHAVPSQCSNSNASCSDKCSGSDVQVHDVVHDRRV
jgi:hypothetical protein